MAETMRGLGKGSRRRLLATALLLTSAVVNAAPMGGQVVAGEGSISQSGSTTTIRQSSQNLTLDWQSFNVAPREMVDFVQPSSTAIAVNRIFDTNGSQILGHLNANGQVFLINPNGVVFGRGAQVNVGGLVASTLDLMDAAVGDVKTFSGAGSGSVVNAGVITAANGGYVVLLGNHVSNQGVINAQLGSVALGAGSAATLTFAGSGLAHMQVDKSVLNSVANNSGLIRADGGNVLMTAGAKDALLASVVNNTGVIDANTVEDKNGSIILTGGMKAGQVNLGGALDVSSATGHGGAVIVTAKNVLIEEGARVSATGATGGGTINIGGSWQGGVGIDQATAVYVSKAADLDAGTTGSGNGGEIVVRSDVNNPSSVTQVYGTLSARGGAAGANGGKIETSGHWLDVTGIAVDASAVSGHAGEWLLDPSNVIIGSATSGSSYTPPNFSPTSNSTILASTISTALNGGSNVVITTGSGSSLGDITVNTAITKTTGAAASLTLQAADSIIINAPISNTSSTGTLGLNLWADNDNGTHDGVGVVILNNSISTAGGAIAFGTGATQSINGVTTLVGGDVYVGGASAINLNTGGGAVGIHGQLIIANANGLNINTANGNVNFDGLVDSGDAYSLVNSSNVTWTAALSAAKSGIGANVGDTYLATITSRLENAVAGAAANYVASWLGGERVTGIGTDKIWRWVAGPEGLQNNGQGLSFFSQNGSGSANGSGGTAIGSAFTNWNGGEPNNYGGSNLSAGGSGEWAMQFVGTQGRWNDLNPASNALPYVRETNLAQSPLNVTAGTGVVTFSQALGINKPLVSLNVTAQTIALSSTTVNTSGGQTFTGQVTVGGVDVNLLTVSANNLTTTYGDVVPALSASYSGFLNGDTAASLTTAATVTTTASAQPNAGSYPITASGVVDVNYYIIYNPGVLIVNLAPLTIAANSASKTYGQANPALTASYSGFVYSDTQSSLTTLATLSTTATSTSNAGTYAITPSGAVAGSNYSILYSNGSLTVNPAVVTLTGLTGTGRNYNGTTIDALTGSGTLSGLINGQTLTLGNATSGTLASANAGSEALTTAVTLGNGTGLASNYALIQPTLANVTIAQAPLTLSGLSGTGRNYDGTTLDALTGSGTLSGLISGETLTLGNATSGTLASANAGSEALTTAATLGNGTGLASNYVLTQPTMANVTIAQAPLTLSGLSGTSRNYDGTTIDALTGSGTLSGLINGQTLTLGNATSGTLASANAGSEALSSAVTLVNGTGLASNYVLTQPSLANVTIAQAPLTLSGLSGTGRNYDGTSLDALTGSGTLSGLINGQTLTLGNATSGTLASANAGSEALTTAVMLGNGTGLASNYALTQPTLANVTIAQAPLTLSGLSGTGRNYDGTTLDALIGTGTLSGLISGETLTLGNAISGTLASANAGSEALTTAVTLVNGTGLASNYALAQPTMANVTIAQAPLTLSGLSGTGRNYNGTTLDALSGTGTLSGLISGETLTLGNATSGTLGSANAGSEALSTGVTLGNGTGLASNYVLTQPTMANVTIAQAALTVTGTLSSDKVYDGTTVATLTNGSLSGVIAGDQVALAQTGFFATKNVGTSIAVAAADTLGGAAALNYVLVQPNGLAANITPLAISVSATGANKVYDGTLADAATLASAGVLAGDGVSFSDSSATFADKNVGNAKVVSVTGISAIGADAGNYTLNNTTASTIANIAQLSSVTWVGPPRGGDWSNPANWAGGAIPDLSNVANVVVPTDSTVNFDASVAGPVSLSGLSGGGLNMEGGILQVISALNLANYTQRGGMLSGTGSFSVTNAFSQSGGQIEMGGAVSIVQAPGGLSFADISGSRVDLSSTTGGVTLGTVTTGGNLTVTAEGGTIAQATGTTLMVEGTTTLAASANGVPADVSLSNPGNRLVQAVNAAGAQVSLNDSVPMTLGTVNAGGDLTVASNGALNIGTSTVGGKLAVNSGNGDISQSGPLRVQGSADILAGTGSIELNNAANIFMVAVSASGSSVGLGGEGAGLPQYQLADAAITQLESSALSSMGVQAAALSLSSTITVKQSSDSEGAAESQGAVSPPDQASEGLSNVARNIGALGPSLRVVNGGVRLPDGRTN